MYNASFGALREMAHAGARVVGANMMGRMFNQRVNQFIRPERTELLATAISSLQRLAGMAQPGPDQQLLSRAITLLVGEPRQLELPIE